MRRALAAAMAGAMGAAGCSTHDCDPSTVDGGAGKVFAEGATLFWESAPSTGPWLSFPGNTSVTFTFPPGFRCVDPCTPTPEISTDGDQGPEAGTFIVGPGYIASFTDQTATGFTVTNASCATYFLRVTASAPAPSASADGGVVDGALDGAIVGSD